MSMLATVEYIVMSGRGDSSWAYSQEDMQATVERMKNLPLTRAQHRGGTKQQPVHVFKRIVPEDEK